MEADTIALTEASEQPREQMTGSWKQWEGQVVSGKFHLRQYLGGSDHSVVFLTELGGQRLQKAALKLIQADPEKAELYLSRLRLAAKLSHPHLIQLYQAGRCQLGTMELLYSVMEFADEDLSQILPHRPLTPAEARDMLKPVLDALGYLHGKGFAHGHIKPTNIMAVADQIRVSSDWLCPMDEPSGGLWKPGPYDPPEAASGRISPAGDVWALGITLAEALTQRIPVRERTQQGDPIVPETLPAPFLELVRHCLCRDPQRRWGVAEIAKSLEPNSPIPQIPTSARSKMVFRKWRSIVPTVAVGLALAALLAVPSLLHRRPTAQRAPSPASEPPMVQPNPEQRAKQPEAGESTKGSSDEKQSYTVPAPSPLSLRTGAETNKPTVGLVRGEAPHQVLPDVPQKARDTIRGKVRVSVRVAVDPSGRVVGTTFDSPGQSKYFANLALQAAHRWEFRPAKLDSRNVPSEWILRFEFETTGTKVFPVQIAP